MSEKSFPQSASPTLRKAFFRHALIVVIVEKIVKNGKVEHMEQKIHGTAEHVEQENGGRRKISADSRKTGYILHKKTKKKL